MIKIILHGHVTRDTETKSYKSSKGDKSMAINAIAVNVGDKTEFLDLVAFGKIGETMAKYVKKGKELLVCGELQSNEYKDKQGNNRRSYSCLVREMEFCGKKDDNSGSDLPQPPFD